MDIAGPYHCGGVGAAYQGLAVALASAGHDVTVLYTSDSMRGDLPHWREWYASRGIRFVHAPQPKAAPLWYSKRKEASLACYRNVVAHGPFDVVHFHEWLGLPYYSLLAKRQGLAFEDTLLCVGTHGPMRWSRAGEGKLAASRDDLIVDFMERRSVELSDVVISPSRYMLDWMVRDGWALPERAYVAQNLLDLPDVLDVTSAGLRGGAKGGRDAPPDEIVFFGRLDRRKGVVFFCDVLDRIAASAPSDLAVSFLGSVVMLDEPSDAVIRRRAASWPFRLSIMTNVDRGDALAYLAEPGRLAVMPSLADNLPCTVQECIAAKIPFLTNDVGGTRELIDASTHATVTVPPRVDAFANRLLEVLASGQPPAAPARATAAARKLWTGWHASLVTKSPPSPPRSRVASVSVCIAHYERPRELAIMLDSLVTQTHEDFDIVVADDGSASESSRAELAAFERGIGDGRVALLRLENSGPGAARHAAAEHARGEYLLFVDDDDYLECEALETLIRVAERTGADVLVSAYRRFRGDSSPDIADVEAEPVVPLGPALAAGLIYPELGGTMIFVRREAYMAVGGFPRERDVDEDWELLLALVAAGFELQAIPETLFWYREREASRSRADNRFARNLSRIRRFEKMLPSELRDLAALAYGQLGGASDESGLRRVDRVRAVLETAARRKAEASKKP